MGAGVKGAGGNSAGVVKGAGGDVYAGADGNVYKKTDSGWQKYTGTTGLKSLSLIGPIGAYADTICLLGSMWIAAAP